jgi:hypothetical protein
VAALVTCTQESLASSGWRALCSRIDWGGWTFILNMLICYHLWKISHVESTNVPWLVFTAIPIPPLHSWESTGKRDKYDKVICNAKIEAIQSWIDTSGAREEMPLSYLISDSDALSVSLFCFLVSLVSTALSCSLCSSLCPLSCNIREGVVPPNTDKS